MAGLNLGKQYGPLPLGGWIAVIIGGLGIGYFINRSQGSGSDSGESDPESETPVGDPSGAGGGQYIYDPPTGVTPPSTSEITDNLTWGKRAKDYLSALPGVDAVTAGNAIERYLSGMSLSVAERALVNLAIAQFGNPPEGVTPVDDTPPTTPPVTPPVTPKPPTVTPKIYAVSIREKPTVARRGQAVAFAGDLSVSTGGKAKPVQALLLVERQKPNTRTWLPHGVDGSNSAGHWGVTTAFGSPGVWGFRVRHSTSGKTATAFVRVT
jgi:hypothetical protein